jgi:hypothetical protein
LFHRFCHHAALSETPGADQYQMVCAFHKLLNISDLHHSVSEEFLLYYSAEFKGVFHITTFFVTTFFVVTAKIQFLFVSAKLFCTILGWDGISFFPVVNWNAGVLVNRNDKE